MNVAEAIERLLKSLFRSQTLPMNTDVPQWLATALDGDAMAIRELVDRLTPHIQARVGAVLLRTGVRRGRDPRQERDDMIQEVFLALFEDGGRKLRSWSPDKGLSLERYAGILAEREVISLLRSGKRNPWTEDPTSDEFLEPHVGSTSNPEWQMASRESLELLLDQVLERLSPLGTAVFEALIVDQKPVEEVCAELNMDRDAVYAWRSRLGKLIRDRWSKIERAPSAYLAQSSRSE